MNYTHLRKLATEHGVYEHCDGQTPAVEHGYCVDDVARALIVAQRDDSVPPEIDAIADTCMDFLSKAQHSDGSLINRQTVRGVWSGESSFGDHWGRALWAWGTVVGRSNNLDRLEHAVGAFHISSAGRSPFLRSMTHAALGAAEYLRRFPNNTAALDLLADTRDLILVRKARSIPWPETRLTYANATIPQALITAGIHLGDPDTVSHGLDMLSWLTGLQTNGDHLSPIGNCGWALGDSLPSFDQQPLEIAHLVDAYITAYDATGDSAWLQQARLGGLWFYGMNDTGVWMHDPRSGGGYDGLTKDDHNGNCGAESTLAYLSTVGQVTAHQDALRAL